MSAFEEIIEGLISGRPCALQRDPRAFGSDELESFTEFGLWLHTFKSLSNDQIESRFNEVRRWMTDFVGANRATSVYLDTTTLYTVERLTKLVKEPMPVTPAWLLDLSNFVNSVILYDHVFHLENEELDSLKINEALGNEPVVIPLPVGSFDGQLHGDTVHSLGAILRGLWYMTKSYVEGLRVSKPGETFYEEGEDIKRAWGCLFELDASSTKWFDSKVAEDHYESDGPALLRDLVKAFSPRETSIRILGTGDDDRLFDFVNECNYRSLFNLMVSYFLRLQYMPNSYRLPFRNALYRKAKVAQGFLPSIRSIDNEYRAFAGAYFGPDQNNLELPFFLSAVLSRISSLDDFFCILAEVRTKASKFRQRRAELDEALSRGDIETAKSLRAAIADESSKLRSLFPYAPVAGAIAAVLAALSGAPTPILLASIGVLTAASLFPPEQVEKLKRRVLRPEYWFLADLKTSAGGLTNAFPRVAQLWPVHKYASRPTQTDFAKHFSRLRSLEY